VVQRANYRPIPVNPSNVSRVSRKLFQTNPMLVYSGVDQPFFKNCQIGKSHSCRHIMMSMFNRGRTAEYRDVKQALGMDNRPTTRFDVFRFTEEIIYLLPEAEFYVLDEIHHAWPRDPNVTGKGHWGIPIYRGKGYNDTMFGFWQKLEGLKQAGKKFLMVTALHPQQAEYLDFLHDTEIPAMAEFFTAPVLELSHVYDD
jgi:hypothetical protein